jgi:hypothetical protein
MHEGNQQLIAACLTFRQAQKRFTESQVKIYAKAAALKIRYGLPKSFNAFKPQGTSQDPAVDAFYDELMAFEEKDGHHKIWEQYKAARSGLLAVMRQDALDDATDDDHAAMLERMFSPELSEGVLVSKLIEVTCKDLLQEVHCGKG